MPNQDAKSKPADTEQGSWKGLDETPCCASFYRGQPVRILSNGKYHAATFMETDYYGVSSVRTEDGRIEQVWDCNIYDAPAPIKECVKCGASAKWSSADCPICFGDLILHNKQL